MKKIIKSLLNKFLKKKVVQKTYESWAAKGYNPSPEVTFVIQTHNKSKNVVSFIEKLRNFPNSEIIVIDDGSRKEESLLLRSVLTQANDFLLHANDLYEVITYDRAIYLARGKYVALLQDDDDFSNLSWAEDAVAYFKKYKDLVFLGGRMGLDLLPKETSPDGKRGEFESKATYEQRINSFKYTISGRTDFNENFRFVQVVIRAPMWVNRQLFIDKIKHIDQSFAPFQWDDSEVCLRAYTLGLKVAWYKTNFTYGGGGEGGMRIWNNVLHHRQDEVNAKKIYDAYGDKLTDIQAMVNNANDTLLQKNI